MDLDNKRFKMLKVIISIMVAVLTAVIGGAIYPYWKKIKIIIWNKINNIFLKFTPDKLTIIDRLSIKRSIRKQKGQWYPCGNQTVVCGFLSPYRNDFEKFKLNYDIKWQTQNDFVSNDGEHWMFYKIGNDVNRIRGCRFYKLKVSKDIDREFFFQYIMPCCVLYCCEIDFI